MATYDKNHILISPELEPKRHYESRGTFKTGGKKTTTTNTTDNDNFEDHPLYSILDKLYRMRGMGKLLPDPEKKVFDGVNEGLIRFTQGLVIDSFENPVVPSYTPAKRGDNSSSDDTDNSTNTNYDSTNTNYDSTNASDDESDIDIFGEDSDYDLDINDQESLYSLAYNAFIRDYNDVAKEYTSSMEQVIHRFFQSMLTLADDADMPDYTYLMEDFDGNAVEVTDKDLYHARDYTVKLQKLRESDTRLMQKEFTAENTLLRGRGWLSAEKQRERYLKANYKVNTSTLCATMGNNALYESRATSEEQYDQGMTNMYKYLNSSTITMGDALDKRINEAALKGELALNGVDIYAKTPEPLPSDTSGLDLNDTSDAEDALGEAIDANATYSMEEDVSSFDVGIIGGGNIEPKTCWNILRQAGYNDFATAGILGNIQQESGFNSAASNGGAYLGLAQWDKNGRWASLVQYAQGKGKDPADGGTQMEYLIYEANNLRYPDECGTAGMNSCPDIASAVHKWLVYFEGAAGQEEGERNAYALKIYNACK